MLAILFLAGAFILPIYYTGVRGRFLYPFLLGILLVTGYQQAAVSASTYSTIGTPQDTTSVGLALFSGIFLMPIYCAVILLVRILVRRIRNKT